MSPQPIEYRRASEPPRPRCAACGSDRTVEGTLTNRVQFRPNKLRKLFSLGTLVRVVDVAAIACTACGAVTLYVDSAAVVRIAGDPGEGQPPAT